MSPSRPAVLAALVLLLPAVALSRGRPPAWTRYANPRFGFSIDYPAGTFVPERAPDNGDGRRFRAIRGGAKFMAWAGRNVQHESPKDFVAATLASCREGRARFALTTKAMAVVSCERRGVILYAKRLYAHGMATGFQMTYPVAERRRWDMALARMAESLTPAKKH